MSVSLAEPILGNERKKLKVLLIFSADLERFIALEKMAIYTTVDQKAKVQNLFWSIKMQIFVRWVRSALRNLHIFVPTISSRSCFHVYYNCDFDNNFAAISNEFLMLSSLEILE